MYLRLVFCKQRVCGDVGCMQVAAKQQLVLRSMIHMIKSFLPLEMRLAASGYNNEYMRGCRVSDIHI
jgi:hypothetical protein